MCLVDRKIRKEGRNCRRLQTAKSYLSIWVSTYILSVFDSDKWIDNSQIIEIKYGTLGFELRFCFVFLFGWSEKKKGGLGLRNWEILSDSVHQGEQKRGVFGVPLL